MSEQVGLVVSNSTASHPASTAIGFPENTEELAKLYEAAERCAGRIVVHGFKHYVRISDGLVADDSFLYLVESTARRGRTVRLVKNMSIQLLRMKAEKGEGGNFVKWFAKRALPLIDECLPVVHNIMILDLWTYNKVVEPLRPPPMKRKKKRNKRNRLDKK